MLSLILRGYENQGMSIKLIHSWKSWLKWVFKTISIFLGWKGQISTGYVKRKTKAGSQAIPPKTSSAPNRETQPWSVLSKEFIKMNPNKASEVSCTGALTQVKSLLKTLSLEPCPLIPDLEVHQLHLGYFQLFWRFPRRSLPKLHFKSYTCAWVYLAACVLVQLAPVQLPLWWLQLPNWDW